MKLLIALPSPRDIPQVIEAQTALPYDKLWIKYTYSMFAYPSILAFFKEHKEYTHIALAPDDLVPTVEGVALLVEDIEREKLDVVSAYCPIDSLNKQGSKDDLAICFNLVEVSREQRDYQWITRKEMEEIKKQTVLLQVKHVGTPFTIFSRKVAENINWNGDLEYNIGNVHKLPVANDVVFCNGIHNLGIKIFVDTRCEFEHLRSVAQVLVNKKNPTIFLQKAGEPYPTDFAVDYRPEN